MLNSQTFSPPRFLLRSTAKSSEPSTRPAEQGATANVANGTFDLDVDSNGRWSVEKFKGLVPNRARCKRNRTKELVAEKGNTIICSADVASVTIIGVLDYTPALNANLNVDDTGNTAGVLTGKYRVYIDPYAANVDSNQYYVVGYKGSSAYDAGLFYAHMYLSRWYVQLDKTPSRTPRLRTQDPTYGIVANPFAEGTNAGLGARNVNANRYRRVKVG